jgi:hypothetical protein
MSTLLLLLVALLVLALVVRHLVTTPAAQLAQQFRAGGGAALLAAGVGLLFFRQFAIALPVGFAGLMMLRRHAAMRAVGPSGQASGVRSAGLEMTLDHDSGEMDGRVLAGRHEGRSLSELNLSELLEVGVDFGADAESLRLLQSYLDRTHPAWRDDIHADETRRKSAPPGSGAMSAKEAYQILGLEPGASAADVRDAHRRLIKQVHPDRGGSTALAAKINEAKDRILGEHR